MTLFPVKIRASRISQVSLRRACRARIWAFLRLPRSCVCQMPARTKGASAATTHSLAEAFRRSSFSQRNSLKQTNKETAVVASSAMTAVMFCAMVSPRSKIPCMPRVRCVDGRELRHHLQPVRHERQRNGGSTQHQHGQVEQLNDNLALLHRIGNRSDDQAHCAEGDDAKTQEDQKRDRAPRHRHGIAKAQNADEDSQRRQKYEPSRNDGTDQDGAWRDRCDFEAPQGCRPRVPSLRSCPRQKNPVPRMFNVSVNAKTCVAAPGLCAAPINSPKPNKKTNGKR